MEGDEIYEISKKEMLRVKSNLANRTVTIDLDKLDEFSKQEVVSALQRTLSERLRAVDKVLLGVK